MSGAKFQLNKILDHNDPTGAVTVHQGEFSVSSSETCILNTVLGSCVSVCFHDPVLKIGGMNHILLPENRSENVSDVIFGLHAMELLINALLKRGTTRQTMQAKIFGGASMISGLSDIGEKNIKFVQQFLRDEGYTVVAEDTGGSRGRRVRFWPATGRVQMRYMIADAPLPPVKKVVDNAPESDIELF